MINLHLLNRFDINPGPISADCIEDGIWLGNLSAAVNIKFLESIKCNHILTIDSCPLPKNIISLPGMTTMHIQLTDMPHEDILSNFENTYNFITEGQKSGVVLVHCYYGVSRSSAIVVAFLMKKHCISFAQSFYRVKVKRSPSSPNKGFINQLRLYERMGNAIDKTLLDWRLFRMRIASQIMLEVKMLPKDFKDIIKPDPASVAGIEDPTVYVCYNCRRNIANKSDIIPHVAGKKISWAEPKSFCCYDESKLCREYVFCEPLAWMGVNEVEGNLYCPKCKCKLGYFNWKVKDKNCPCKARMVPCFSLVASKLKLCNLMKRNSY